MIVSSTLTLDIPLLKQSIKDTLCHIPTHLIGSTRCCGKSLEGKFAFRLLAEHPHNKTRAVTERLASVLSFSSHNKPL